MAGSTISSVPSLAVNTATDSPDVSVRSLNPDDPASAVTTYEALRDGSATALLIHMYDAHGVSQAHLYDAVAVDDLVEWHQAGDCFVRYQVTEVKADPTGTVPQKLLAVAWMTYAYTGCSGAVAADTAATFEWGDLPDRGGTSLTVPIRHTIFQIVPDSWRGAIEPGVTLPHPVMESSYTEDLATARGLPRWREPALPAGWTLLDARVDPSVTPFGYAAHFGPATRVGLTIQGGYAADQGYCERAYWRTTHDKLSVHETRLIAGRPAIVRYSLLGPNHKPLGGVVVWVYDAATESQYSMYGEALSLSGANVDALIAIARSLFEPPNPP